MANEQQVKKLKQDYRDWNEWRSVNPNIQPDLSKADLHHADFGGKFRASAIRRGANYLGGVNLSRANLREIKLRNAQLSFAEMWEADLRSADLEGAILIGVRLQQANLESANLEGANLSGANLMGANLSKAYMCYTILADVDLSTIQGLETVKHGGPSQISIDALIKSKGKIPEVFLRGCGIPESFIEYIPSLIGAMQPIQFFKCFLSHSTKNHDFAQRLYDRMQGQGIRVWFAPEELKGGRLLDDQIDHAIRLHDKLILVLSDESIRSKWVMKEIRKARREELANNRRKLFPIRLTDMQTLENWECLDPETGHDLADVVRSYFIPDFSNWKDHDSFERAFTRFLDALKAVDEPPVDGQDKEKRLAYLQRQLNAKQIAKAKFGLHVPTYIELEIEDLMKEIALLGGASTE